MSDLYRLVYASRNLFQGSDAENAAAVSQILAASQRNNARVEVTGALMFNDGAFAQVLEGPRQGVEATFERIQRDPRHGEVTVLQCEPVESRSFPNWSMAFVGQSLRGRTLWSDLASESGFDLARLNGDEVFTMLHGLVLEEEGLAPIGPAPAADRLAAPAAGCFDVAQVRRELARLGRDPGRDSGQGSGQGSGQDQDHGRGKAAPAAAPVPAGDEAALVALAIFRAALAGERARTTELRNELDALQVTLQVALAEAETRARGLARERDLWARRARVLAEALDREADALGAAPDAAPARQTAQTASAAIAA